MSEPKQALLIAAARKKWPKAIGFRINHRKHTIAVSFGSLKGAPNGFEIQAESHAKLLENIEAAT